MYCSKGKGDRYELAAARPPRGDAVTHASQRRQTVVSVVCRVRESVFCMAARKKTMYPDLGHMGEKILSFSTKYYTHYRLQL